MPESITVQCKMNGHLTELPCSARNCPLFGDCIVEYEKIAKTVETMVVKKTTDDFRNLESAKAKGCYRLHFFCPGCGLEVGHETYDSNYMFGRGSVLHSNYIPKFCPDCGTKLIRPEVPGE